MSGFCFPNYMKITIKKQIGKALIELDVEEKSEKETLAKATFYLEPDYCGLCKNTNIIWTSRRAKTDEGDTYTYIIRKCLNKDCLATSTAGEYKTGGFFWKRWEIYQPSQKSEDTQTSKEIIEKELDNAPF